MIYKFLDPEGILHGTQREQLVTVHAREARPYRLCAGRKQQLVIALFKFFTRFQILYGNGLSVGMNCGNFVVYFHVNTEPGEEALRGLECQILRIFDDTANVIRQTAVGIGNIA